MNIQKSTEILKKQEDMPGVSNLMIESIAGCLRSTMNMTTQTLKIINKTLKISASLKYFQ